MLTKHTFITLPAEIRLMILRNVLCCKEVLSDVPTVVSTIGAPDTILVSSLADIRRYEVSKLLGVDTGTTPPATNGRDESANRLLDGEPSRGKQRAFVTQPLY